MSLHSFIFDSADHYFERLGWSRTKLFLQTRTRSWSPLSLIVNIRSSIDIATRNIRSMRKWGNMITRSIERYSGYYCNYILKRAGTPVALIPHQCRDYNLQRDRDVIVTKRRGEFPHRLARIIVQSSRHLLPLDSRISFRSAIDFDPDVGDRTVHTSSVGP